MFKKEVYNKSTITLFIKKANKKHNFKYNYSKSIYFNAKTKIEIICKYHNVSFWQIPNNHLSGSGCSLCRKVLVKSQQALTQEEFLQRSISKHGNKYDYSKCVYSSLREKVIIICKKHNYEFSQLSESHMNGRGCKKCAYELLSKKFKFVMSFKYFIDKANKIHNFKYDYSKTIFNNISEKIIIICKEHKEFEVTPINHINRKIGCYICYTENQTKEFIQKANKIHNFKYDYSETIYIGSKNKLKIICKIKNHGLFMQTANSHISGRGCIKCVKKHNSKIEIAWLDSLNIPQEFRNQVIKINNKNFYPDAIDKENKIIYEFYGDFWHGNPKVYNSFKINIITGTIFGKLYEKTLNKEKFLKENGYQVIYMWEYDWNIKNDK